MKKMSFSTRLSINILLATSVLFLTAIGIAAYYSHKLLAEEAENASKNLLNSTINEIETTLCSIEAAVEVSSWDVASKINSEEELYEISRRMVKDSEVIKGFGIAFKPNYFKGRYFFCPYSRMDENGDIITTNLQAPEYNYLYSDWYLIPMLKGSPVWMEPYQSQIGLNEIISTFCYPIKDDKGEVYAVLVADLPLKWISDLSDTIKPYGDGFVNLISRNGAFITFSNVALGETVMSYMERAESEVPGSVAVGRRLLEEGEGMVRFDLANNRYFMVFGKLYNGWTATLLCAYTNVLRRTHSMHLILILVGLFGLLILFVICYFTIRHLTRPLLAFSDSARSIAKGDFNTPLPEISSNDEIRQMRDSFDYMKNSLVNYIDELKQTTAVKERIESELNIASEIQMQMLPHDFPSLENIDLYALLHPAKEVGGDLYDFFIIGDYLYFTVGDVSGKGIPASLFMAMTRVSFRTIASMGFAMDEIVEKLGTAMCEGNSSNMFVTLFAGRINIRTRVMEYCNAGHNPIIKVDKDDVASFVPVKPNIALGVMPGFPYQMQTLDLKQGDKFLLYTDGVTEAERADKSQYGEERLLQWSNSASCEGLTAEQAAHELYKDVKDFVEGNEANDDITIMTISIH